MRSINTLRVSVTDRCNLRCVYCQPPDGVKLIPHHEILSFEEIERVARTAVAAGVRKVRITGGEPLVRRGIVDLVAKLSKIKGIQDLPMTTNGVLLVKYAEDLKSAGLSRVTVSMDTMRPDRFEDITRKPWLDRVMEGIEAAYRAELLPVKVNVVVVPGLNEEDALDFARTAREHDFEVRFIERMPIIDRRLSPHCGAASEEYIPSAELKERIEMELGPLKLRPGQDKSQPAKVYDMSGARGRVGFIAPMSEPFCKWCARMRLTPDGRLRACLAEDVEVDVKGPIRSGISDKNLLILYEKAVHAKPRQEAACFAAGGRIMSQIGG